MEESDWQTLRELVTRATRDVFESLQVDLCPRRDAHQRLQDAVSLTGFTGDMVGWLMVSVPELILERTHPSHSTAREDLLDWLGELNNLILGRVKNRLSGYGLTLKLSTPSVVSGMQLIVSRRDPAMAMSIMFQPDDVAVRVSVSEAAPKHLVATDSICIAAEGDVLMF